MNPLGWVSCAHCGAISLNAPPHGEGQACPQKIEVDRAYMEMMDAQKLYYLNAGLASGDQGQSMKEMAATIGKMLGRDDS